jgi:hypothetical protein
VSVTSVIEKTRLATVIIEPAIVARTCRAPSGPIRSTQRDGSSSEAGITASRASMPNASSAAAQIIAVGTTNRFAVSRDQRYRR